MPAYRKKYFQVYKLGSSSVRSQKTQIFLVFTKLTLGDIKGLSLTTTYFEKRFLLWKF